MLVMCVSLPMTASAVDLGTITLINGDVNNDNTINDADVSALMANMDQVTTVGDLDGDTAVTTTDLSIVLKNLGLSGDL